MLKRFEDRHGALALGALVAALVACAGCGKSLVVAEQRSDNPAADADTDSDSDGNSDASADAGAPEPVVLCGNAQCKNVKAVIQNVEVGGYACCTPQQECGVVETPFTCLSLHQPGKPDATCQGIANTPLGDLDGCCRPDGICGVNETTVGLGCTTIPFFTQNVKCVP